MFISSTKLWREIRYFHVVVVHIIGDLGAVSRVGRKGARRKIGSLCSDVFERRTSTGSKLFALLSHDFKQIFGQNVSIRMKTLCNTNTVASRLIKREEGSLPVYSLFMTSMDNSLIPLFKVEFGNDSIVVDGNWTTYVLFTCTDANVSHLARISWTRSHVPSSYRLLCDTKRYFAMDLYD